MTYDKIVMLIRFNDSTGEWDELCKLHARVNKTGGTEYYGSGAYQSKGTLTFDVRYSPQVSSVFLNTQVYRIRYEGHEYDIEDVDDYMQKHRNIKMIGVARGV